MSSFSLLLKDRCHSVVIILSRALRVQSMIWEGELGMVLRSGLERPHVTVAAAAATVSGKMGMS